MNSENSNLYSISDLAEQVGVPEVRVWKLVRDTSRQIARERGLV